MGPGLGALAGGPGQGAPARGLRGYGRTYIRTYGRTDEQNILCIQQDIVPLGPLLKKVLGKGPSETNWALWGGREKKGSR